MLLDNNLRMETKSLAVVDFVGEALEFAFGVSRASSSYENTI